MVLGALVSVLLYAGLLQIPTRHLFATTTWLLTLLAAGMAATAVNFLAQGGILMAGGTVLWDTSDVLRDNSLVGQALHVLVGYTDRPTEAQLIAYVGVVVGILLLTRWAASGAPPSNNSRVASAAE